MSEVPTEKQGEFRVQNEQFSVIFLDIANMEDKAWAGLHPIFNAFVNASKPRERTEV